MTFSVQQVLVCVARTDGGPAVPPCGVDGTGVGYSPGVASFGMFDVSTAALLDANSGPIDYGACAELWSFAFATTFALWGLGKAAGAILSALR